MTKRKKLLHLALALQLLGFLLRDSASFAVVVTLWIVVYNSVRGKSGREEANG